MAQTRVHELAKEFGVESQTILGMLREMGEFIKSSSSLVPMPVEMRFRKEYGGQLRREGGRVSPPPRTSSPQQAPRIPFVDYQRRPRSASRPPGPKTRPNQNLIDASRIFAVPVEELKPAKEERPRGRYASSESRRPFTAWDEAWIDDEERREWIAVGLGPDDGRTAGQLKERGVTPDDLLLRIDGRRVNERLRGGESVGSIVARLKEFKRNRRVG